MAYFGPEATFTQEALLTQPDLAAADLRALASITAVLEAVAQGEVDCGFVPIENGIEGTVSATIDGLIHDVDLHIQREVVMDIHLHLMACPGTGLQEIHAVSSYPHALAQCQKYLARTLPEAEQRVANSTADAARVLGQSGTAGEAAIAPRLAAERYGEVPMKEAQVIVALGGDGFMLETLHANLSICRPIHGMNRGSVGFLMNE